jgi:hypothetical protein
MGKKKRIPTEALREQRQAFVEKFGREPGPADPVFFDPDADSPVPLSEEKVRAAMLEAMQDVGIPLHLVYAYTKTGFIVGDDGYKNMRPADRAAYNAAIDEYFAMEEAKKRH